MGASLNIITNIEFYYDVLVLVSVVFNSVHGKCGVVIAQGVLIHALNPSQE